MSECLFGASWDLLGGLKGANSGEHGKVCACPQAAEESCKWDCAKLI